MRKLGLVLMLLLTALLGAAQPTYIMGNQTVTECRAFFEDSGGNPIAPGNYNNNENFTFVILNPQATQIIMTFQSFCTEIFAGGFGDRLRIFDGPDTNGVLLGSFSGPNVIFPPLVATSGAMTIHFQSDLSVTCTGWNAYWYSIVPPPVPPTITQITASCLTNTIDVVLDSSVHCDSVYASAFVLSGAPARTIVGAQALNCVNNRTNTLRLTVNTAFSDCATYGLDWNLNLLDICDSLYTFLINSSFAINNCPLSGSLTASDDSICIGECVLLTAAGIGGDCNYTYSWSNGLPPTAGPHLVCPPPGTTTYTVIINDGAGNGPDTLNIPILVTNPPEAGADTLVCLSSAPFNLAGRASPPGGVFFGPGITAAAAGTFNPALANQTQVRIFYSVNGCADSLTINIADVTAGPTAGSCPGGPPFTLGGASPPGGYWTGPYTDSAGNYTPPPTARVDTVLYHFAGCTAQKLVFIDTIAMNKIDTICQSSPPYQLVFNPPGGSWSGVALVDPLAGIIDPQLTLPGDHQLIYNLNGCIDTLNLHIKAIQAGAGFITCPLNAPFNLPAGTPAGGYWTGPGITDSLLGTFNPGINGTGNSQIMLAYNLDGCVDSLQINLVRTNVPADTLRRCITGAAWALNFANTGRGPAGGTWSGPGVNPAGQGSFDPAVAGVGWHRLFYTANNCTDSLWMEVQPVPQLQADTVVCLSTPPFAIQTSYAGGVWSGPGITDTLLGIFNPATAGAGNRRIYQFLFGGCIDSILITVQPIPVISFGGFDTSFCFVNTDYPVPVTPAGGTLTGPGITALNFNPRQAGVGTHWLRYTVGAGDCERTDSLRITVGDSLRLQLFASADTLCYGDSVTLRAQLSGGRPGASLSWQPIGSSDTLHTLLPTVSTWYVVTATDGCSDPITDSIQVFVHPDFVYQQTQIDINCYDSLGTMRIDFAAAAPYRVLWLTNPAVNGPVLQAQQGSYRVLITDTTTGCTRIDTATIIAHDPISANFTPNPNRNSCYDLSEAFLTLIDLSLGAQTGFWDFGDGTIEPYIPGQYPSHQYTDTGRFELRLFVENPAGCSDLAFRSICVVVLPRIYVPTAFTPNFDLTNDRFKVATVGITSLEITVFDRWGLEVYKGSGIDFEWDGTKNGAELPAGAYPYVIFYTDFTNLGRRMQSGVVRLIK